MANPSARDDEVWSATYEQRAARMREQAEPPMPRMRRNLKRERDLRKYAALYEIMQRLARIPSSLDASLVFRSNLL